MKILLLCCIVTFFACTSSEIPAEPKVIAPPPVVIPVAADAASILSKKEVPILCYHQIRAHTPEMSRTTRDYVVTEENFRAQMKFLSDSGYHSITPDQLYQYLLYGEPLPEKPVMITFDDTRIDQYTVGLTELEKYGFKGVFFIMTVSIDRPGYMSVEDIVDLSDRGHVIGSHTWNHENVKKLSEGDWEKQLDDPARKLEAISGGPIRYFAYPFGLWDENAIEQLKTRNYKLAFQLASKRDESDPLHTVRRIIVPGDWTVDRMKREMERSF